MNLDLEDRAFLVTGAGGGVGAAVAAGLDEAGARTFLTDLHEEALEQVRAELRSAERHQAATVDLRDVNLHAGLVESAVKSLGQLDGLVHLAAALRRRQSIYDVSEEDWDLQVDLNLKATFFLNREVARSLRRAGGGCIVNFASQAWWTGGFGGSTVYAATKGGVVALSRGLARTLAPDGIRVNTIAPGAVDTPMMHADLTERELAGFVDAVPLGRMAEPEEIAGVAVFLCSDRARYMTGATVNVSGGQIVY